MPNRIRSHVLEERSLGFLREVFPDSWTIHSFTRDYGIDIQVEVFAENGDRTGIRFYGQVKATDKDETDDLLRLDRSHFEYWSKHTDPVALFRYFDKTRQLRWCWLHDVDWLIKPGNESLDVAPLLKPWALDISPADVESNLHARRQALFIPLTPPYEISVEQLNAEHDATPIIAARIANSIQSKSFRVLPREIAIGHFQLIVAPNKLASSYSGLPGFVFHYEEELSDDELIEMSLLAIFLCACRYERILFARSLATLSTPLLYRAAGNKLRPKLFDALIFCLGLKQTVEIITPLMAEEEDSSLDWLIFATTCATASWRYGEAHSWTTLLRQWSKTPPVPENKGTFMYNLGNSLFSQGEWFDACRAYQSALANDSTYAGRPYFWGEFGASHFESGNYEEAARCYEKALKLEESPAHRWRLADSLFHLAEFAKARAQLQIALPNITASDESYAHLLMRVCDESHSVWGLDSQTVIALEERDHELLLRPNVSMNEDELISYLKPVITKNAIDDRFNFNAGVFASRAGHHSIAGYRFLNCALRQRGDAEAWVNALLCAFNSNDNYLAVLTAKVAHFYIGEEFLPRVLGMMPGGPQIPAEIAEAWRSLMIELADSFERDHASSEEAQVLRIHAPDGTQVFHLK